MKLRIVTIFAGMLILATQSAQAIDIDISGYASFSATNANTTGGVGNDVTYLNSLADKNITFNTTDSIIGLQFSSEVSKEVDITLVMQAVGGPSNYDVT